MNPLETLLDADPTVLAKLGVRSDPDHRGTHPPLCTWDNRPSWDNWTKHK